jgi:hypothetical protein
MGLILLREGSLIPEEMHSNFNELTKYSPTNRQHYRGD